MAVDKATSVARRRVVYGANAVLQIVLVILVVVGAVYLSQRYKRQADLTRSGVNSLSPRTTAMLRSLPENVTITGIYTVLSEYDTRAQKRRDTVRDLLALYESAGRGKVTANLVDPMKDRVQLPALLRRLRDKPAYKDEAKKHEEALQSFPALNKEIADVIGPQAADADRLLNSDPTLNRTVVVDLSLRLRNLARRGDEIMSTIQELQKAEIPRYGQAVEEARKHIESVEKFFRDVADYVQNASPEKVPPAALDFVQKASQAYQALLPKLTDFTTRAQGLKRVELEELSDQLDRWANAPPILVETPDKAQIVAFNEVWPYRTDQNAPPPPDGDEREFAGEQATSSAILKLTQKEKTALIFTRFGGQSPITPDFSQMNMNMRQMPRAPYGALNDLLLKENFVTLDWDVATQKTPPKPEDAARLVYVVFPAAPPPQQDPRRQTPPPSMSPADVKIVTDAVNAAAGAIFLAAWTPPISPVPGMGEGKYDYGEYLSSMWGIQVENAYLTLSFAPSPENPKLFIPTRDTQRAIIDSPVLQFTDQPIAKPLHTAPGGINESCPLKLAAGDKAPAGVTAEPVALIRDTNDVWAIKDIMRLNEDFRSNKGTYRRDDDIAAPFPVAVAAKNDKDQRLVVFASAGFVSNQVLDTPGGIVLLGGGFQTVPAYPANPDLFINAAYWVTNDAGRISIGAQRADAPRLSKLKDDRWLTFWHVFLVGIWPGMALVVGGGVWLFRRR
jgi:hypothetical protein